jgi:hypothetical protein
MTRDEKAQKLPISAWSVGSLRLTAFPSPPLVNLQATRWIDITGQNPENVNEQPRQGMRQETGHFGQGDLILTVKLDRIDLLYTVATTRQIQADLPAIGVFPDALETFLAIVLDWLTLETYPAIDRLAFGAILLYPTATLEDSYRQLLAYLPGINPDLRGSRDFLYQINRPRKTETDIPELKINRLSKWATLDLVEVLAKVSPSPESPKRVATSRYLACRVELDINTSSEFEGELPRVHLPALFEELVAVGQEILDQGDIP